MRGIVFNYPTMTANEICATQTTTATDQALIINGTLSNIGQGRTPFAAVFPAIQRSVQISSTGNISTSTFTISGFDCRATGLLTTTIAGPTGLLIPTHTVTEYNRVTAISVGTLASSTFTIGGGATGSTNWVHAERFVTPFSLNCVVVTGTSQPITIQDTSQSAALLPSPVTFNFATLTTVTINQEAAYTAPVVYVRAVFTATLVAAATSSATTAGQVTFLQAGLGP